MAAKKRKGLGRGLDALIKESPVTSAEERDEESGMTRAPVAQIRVNPFQPRQTMESGALEELVHSIRTLGVLQPLLVRRSAEGYELIAGERRLTASREAGLTDVPVVIMDVTDQEALELALVENLQREDLNLIEEAEGYRVLRDKFGMTQEQVAERVGKARTTVANALRVLGLPDAVRRLLQQGAISPGHAKVLLSLDLKEEQELLARRIARESLSVRALERIVQKLRKIPKKPRARKSDIPESHLRYLTDRLHQHLGTSVRLTPSATLANGRKASGSIQIDYYSNEELDRILSIIGFTDEL